VRRVLVSVAVSFTILAIASCGGGGGDSASSDGTSGRGTPVAYDSVTTTVTGTAPDAAVGDTSVLLLTGAPPASSRIAHPIFPFFASELHAGSGSVTLPDSTDLTIDLASATQLNVTTAQDTFDHSTGAKTGSSSYNTVDTLAVHTAPPATGAFTATVTTVTTGDSVSAGDTFRVLITPPGFISIESDELSVTGLVKNGSTWNAQASSWHGSAVGTTNLSLSADLSSGTYLGKLGGTTELAFTFSMSALTLPATVTGAKTPDAASAFAGNAPGYTTTAYILANRPADTAMTIALDPAAGTATLGSSQFHLYSLARTSGGNTSIIAIRYFTDATLTTTDKRAAEYISLEFTAAGVLVTGFSVFTLWQDPTPANDGGSGENDIYLGIIELVP
jgi:hypothetical protein